MLIDCERRLGLVVMDDEDEGNNDLCVAPVDESTRLDDDDDGDDGCQHWFILWLASMDELRSKVWIEAWVRESWRTQHDSAK